MHMLTENKQKKNGYIISVPTGQSFWRENSAWK